MFFTIFRSLRHEEEKEQPTLFDPHLDSNFAAAYIGNGIIHTTVLVTLVKVTN